MQYSNKHRFYQYKSNVVHNWKFRWGWNALRWPKRINRIIIISLSRNSVTHNMSHFFKLDTLKARAASPYPAKQCTQAVFALRPMPFQTSVTMFLFINIPDNGYMEWTLMGLVLCVTSFPRSNFQAWRTYTEFVSNFSILSENTGSLKHLLHQNQSLLYHISVPTFLLNFHPLTYLHAARTK